MKTSPINKEDGPLTLEEYGMERYWEGMEEAKTEIIKLLLGKGKTTEEISELCGFPPEEIEKIRETNHGTNTEQ